MKKLLWILALITAGTLAAQEEDFEFADRVYADNIKSVKFHIAGLPLSQPIIDLDSEAPLVIRFDDLEGDVKSYTYSIIHCTIDWQRSQLTDMEYMEGFSGLPIRDYRFGYQTVTPFTHYSLSLPNQDLRWTKSGNYLLIIYEDEGDRRPVITRRFLVVDPIVQIQPQLVRPAQVSRSRSHQEVDFIVDHEELDIRTPLMEVRAVVVQNGRWETAVTDIPPAFTRYRQLIFDHQDRIVFPAGKEFRFLDLRSLRNRSETIYAIERYRDRNEVILLKDEKRVGQSYNYFQDINGEYIIESFDNPNSDLASDYAGVLFSLASSQPLHDHDVYIIGEMNDWQPREEFRMIYNNSINAYVAKPLLKQGYYNFAYGTLPKGAVDGPFDLSEIEGDWYLTENEYTILVYYRPFGSRYDQLIGVRTFSSTPR